MTQLPREMLDPIERRLCALARDDDALQALIMERLATGADRQRDGSLLFAAACRDVADRIVHKLRAERPVQDATPGQYL